MKSQKLKVSNYSQLISIENIFQAWDAFKKGKRNKYDVMVFERDLEDNLFGLHGRLKNKNYRHGHYSEFYINDPKRRHIHNARTEDRVVHQLLYSYLYAVFDKTFIFDSYSCRVGKGTHRAVLRLEDFTRKVSKSYREKCWALKLDIKKFFDSVDHEILLKLISNKVRDENIIWLVKIIIESFHSNLGFNKGMPLGNLTSQIFANVYLNELDQFAKHEFKVKYYLRYADDFLILENNMDRLFHYINIMKSFLENNLKLKIHADKIIIRKLVQGIDFCGYVVLPHYRLLRSRTKNRMLKKFQREKISDQALQSYFGHLSHASSYGFAQELKNKHWFYQVK